MCIRFDIVLSTKDIRGIISGTQITNTAAKAATAAQQPRNLYCFVTNSSAKTAAPIAAQAEKLSAIYNAKKLIPMIEK